MDEEKLSAADEHKLLGLFEQSSLHDYPNPDRVGCPGSGFLRTLAFNRKLIPITDPRLDHVPRCSPCFREFIDYRTQARRSRVRRRITAIAAVFLVATGLNVYFATSGGGMHPGQATDLTASLDLKYFIVPRGLPESGTPAEEPRIVHRRRLALTIILPLESEPGTYEFEVVLERGKPLAQAKGEARLQNGLTVASVALDLSAIPTGDYSVRFRRDSQGWAYCPVRVLP